MKGAADAEVEASTQLRDAARNGDSKAALAILQHSHGWATAKESTRVAVGLTNADGSAMNLVIGWEE